MINTHKHPVSWPRINFLTWHETKVGWVGGWAHQVRRAIGVSNIGIKSNKYRIIGIKKSNIDKQE